VITEHSVRIDYTNWRGERRQRVVTPRKIVWSYNRWHPKQQWLLEAYDVEGDDVLKTFAMSNIHSWEPVQ
jgi:predicted DNA-binding transcriptional regulator YafY